MHNMYGTPTPEQLSTLLLPQYQWGKQLSVVCSCSEDYLPGYYSMYNSLIMNGFQGKFIFTPLSENAAKQLPAMERVQLATLPDSINNSTYHVWLKRIYPLLGLPDGDYLFCDTDIIFERPCGWLESMLDEAPIVSIDPAFTSPGNDVLYSFRARRLGIKFPLQGALCGYPNPGLMLVRFPRDRAFIHGFINATIEATNNPDITSLHALLPWLEQDIMLLFYHKFLAEGKEFLVINHTVLEHHVSGSCLGRAYIYRPFPWTSQSLSLVHRNYIIHGAALRRPWLWMRHQGLKPFLYRLGLGPWIRRLIKNNITSYERAWL
ncbi:MAG TPA: hypothetical protein PLV25_06290, partial [Opitutales bacterium]|nr:hypothetical protein [Opitutales bacterium]